MDIQNSAQYFPGLKDKTFLDAACVGLAPIQAKQAIDDFLDIAIHCPAKDSTAHHIQLDSMRQTMIKQAAQLVKCQQKNMALVESTTHGLNIAANSIPLSKGNNVLIADTEYLQVAIPWAKKQANGIDIKPVNSLENGALPISVFEQAIDSHTKVICVSSVQWCSGYRLDIKQLAELCHSRNIWLVVDAIQELGAMSVDLSDSKVDFLIAGGHKWLNAPYGCGLMYISDKVLNQLEPPMYGYLALKEPQGGWGQYFATPEITPYRDFQFPKTAKTFEIAGTTNYPGAIGLGASLKIFNELGSHHIESRIRTLTDLLHYKLHQLNLNVITSEDHAVRSGITVFNCFDSVEENKKVLDALLKQKIYASMRYTSQVGGIRISTHFYNDEADIERLAHVLQGLLS